MRAIWRAVTLLALAAANLAGQTAITVTPTSLAFGEVVVGDAATLNVTISSNLRGQVDVTLQVIGTQSFFPDTTSFTITDETPRVVGVAFIPMTAGFVSATLQIQAFSGSQLLQTALVSLSGTGIPPFTFSPAALDFGNVLVGCGVTQELRITSRRNVAFTLVSNNAAVTPNPASLFGIGEFRVLVTFNPTAAARMSSSIRVIAEDDEIEMEAGAISVTGVGFDVSFNPAPLDFGSVPVGGASTRLVSIATNPTVQSGLQFSAASSSLPFSIGAVSSTQAEVTFRPTAEGTVAGSMILTISRTDGAFVSCNATRTLALRGTGTPVPLTLNPTSLDFGRVSTGTTSPDRNVSLNNGSNLAFNGTAASSNPAFLVRPASFTLGPNSAQAFTLNFRPSATGPASATVTFNLTSTSAAAAFQTRVTLEVTGDGQIPIVLTVNPATIDFGDVTVGTTASRTATVGNTGQALAAVTAASSQANIGVNPASFNVNAGGSQQVTLTFSPSAAGPVQARIDFSVPGAAGVSVTVTGRGVVPSFSYTFAAGQSSTPVSPGGNIGLPHTPVGSSNAVDFQIRNDGTAASTLSRITVSGGGFGLVTPPALPATLGPGEALSVRVSFQPAAPGNATGALSVDDQSFSLSGRGLVRAVNFTGTSGSVAPLTQPALGIQVPDRSSVPLSGQLVLEFSPNALGGGDPSVQFATGGRTVNFTIPANSDSAVFPGGASQIAFQTGSVAGTIGLRLLLQAGGVDVSPMPAPSRSFLVDRSAPLVRSVSIANRTATGFQLVITGLTTTREVNTATFRLTASGTGSLQTTTLTLDLSTLFANWYASAEAGAFGSQFTLTVPFNIQGDLSAIRSISVTLSNGDGTSPAVEAGL